MKFALAIAFSLATIPAAIAQSQPPPTSELPPGSWPCDMVLPSGQTAQEQFDALWSKIAADVHQLPEMREEARSAKGQFDNLCRVDWHLDTREASAFVEEESNRWRRLSAVMIERAMRILEQEKENASQH